MDSINLADLREQLGDLVQRVEAGESVELVRHGQPFARVTPAVATPRNLKPIDFEAIRRVRESLPMSSMTVEEMRRLDLL